MRNTYKTYLRGIGRRPAPVDRIRTVKRDGDRELTVVQNANVAVVIGAGVGA